MQTRQLGHGQVAEIGFGCMNLSHAYGAPPPPAEGSKVLLRALELGVTHFDTAALYGFGGNEELVGATLASHRQKIHLASKCGMTGVDKKRVIDGKAQTIKQTCQESLKRLRTDFIDLYYLHRWDKSVPIEESVGALADLVRAGSIRAIGLSEVSAATLRKAHAVHPIAAVQSEYSLWTRNPEIAVLKTCDELGVTFVPFSPVGRGFLAGGVQPTTFIRHDIRRTMPRFCEPQYSGNLRLFERFQRMATDAHCTPAQLALAWLLTKHPGVVPIPGTTSIAHLEENMRASDLKIDAATMAAAEDCFDRRVLRGERYPSATQLEIDTENFAD
ncbi:MAG TPA: aldo/keto reductase [Steroidobacteraceae bacterium]|nr:aldo/keto reductase [Steroidobacteraceae bacterium]